MPTREDLLGGVTEWTEVATATNGTATATRAAVTGKIHYISGISISANGQPAAAVAATVTDGATTKDRFEIPALAFSPIIINYVRPIRCTVSTAANVTLPALGAAITGTVVIKGFTRST